MDEGRVLVDAPPPAFFASEHTRAREFLRRVHAVPAA
jgi:hypothetical protein